MPCMWGVASPICEHQAPFTSALVRQRSCCRLAKQHAFITARKVCRKACRIRAVDKSQDKSTDQENTEKQGESCCADSLSCELSPCTVSTACTDCPGPLKQQPRPAVVGPGTNLGELQLLPNRRFFLAAAGSLSISMQLQ